MGTLGGWSKRQKLTINHNKIDDELTDFPVKVIIPSDNPLFYTAKNDGSDVRFTAVSYTHLNEIYPGDILEIIDHHIPATTVLLSLIHI